VPLNPLIQEILSALSRELDQPEGLTPEQFRAVYNEQRTAIQGEEVASVEDLIFAGPDGIDLPVRVFTPHGVDDHAPATVYYHGGGWVIGSVDTHDAECRALANRTRTVVVSVDYRLAPEHPYPAAPDDCYAALCHVVVRADDLGIDPCRLAVAGDSAGGNLATVVALMARDRGGPAISHQMLIYPCCDIDPDRWPSMAENGTGYLLTESTVRWFYRHYVGTERFVHEPYAAPIRATDLSGLPPAQVVTAEFDPLRDEGAAYARALAGSGVETHYECASGLVHGFWSFADVVPEAAAVRDGACSRLVAALR
jgi:acetyl esterase